MNRLLLLLMGCFVMSSVLYAQTSQGNMMLGKAIGFRSASAYFFNEHWAAELGLGWWSVTSYNPDTEVDNDNQTHVGFSMNSFSPRLGVRYHL